MTWGPWARRRADDFDAAVERSSTGVATDDPDARDAEFADLLELVGALRTVPDPQPRPEFVADLRSRLLTEAATALVPTDVSKLRLPARRTARERRLAAVVGGLVIAGTTASVAVASQSALPGESLYPIKRVIESAHAGLSPGDARKGDVELANATSRLDEAAALARSSDDGAALRIGPTLATFTDQAGAGADLLLADYADTGRAGAIARLRDFASGSMGRLEQLEPLVPDDARDELIAAADLMAQLDAEADRRCPGCGGTPLDGVPPSLLAVEIPDLSEAPPVRQEPTEPERGPKHATTTATGGAGDEDGLPGVPGTIPPGSVTDPGEAASSPANRPDPIKTLTDGLAETLTGGSSPSSSPSSGSGAGPPSGADPSPSTGPLPTVVEGVDELLHGVLDPITGRLLPTQQ